MGVFITTRYQIGGGALYTSVPPETCGRYDRPKEAVNIWATSCQSFLMATILTCNKKKGFMFLSPKMVMWHFFKIWRIGIVKNITGERNFWCSWITTGIVVKKTKRKIQHECPQRNLRASCNHKRNEFDENVVAGRVLLLVTHYLVGAQSFLLAPVSEIHD